MRNFEFIKYDLTPHDRHKGIAHVRAYGKISLRFKVIPKKNGEGTFPAAPSIRMGTEPDISYLSAFSVDSKEEESELMSVLRDGIGPNPCRSIPEEEMPF